MLHLLATTSGPSTELGKLLDLSIPLHLQGSFVVGSPLYKMGSNTLSGNEEKNELISVEALNSW